MNTTIHINIDKQTRDIAKRLAKELGLDLSTVVKASLRNFVVTKSFHVEKGYRMTPFLEGVIKEADKERKTYGPFKTARESIRFLRSSKCNETN